MYGTGDQEDYDDDQEFAHDEYAVDDSLSPVDRLDQYKTSDFALQRLVLCREIDDTVRSSNVAEVYEKIIDPYISFSKDAEPAVRDQFVQKMVFMCTYLKDNDGDNGYAKIKDKLWGPFAALIVDKNVQVQESAVAAFIELSKIIKDEDLDELVLAEVIKRKSEERDENHRQTAAQLFNDLAERFGKDMCEAKVLDHITSLAGDEQASVRKTVATNLGKLMTVVGADTSVAKIFPVWQKLCGDSTWGVRKACCEHSVEVSKGVTAECRKGDLLTQYMKFREDESRWVKICANQQLGQFIHTLPSEDVTAELVKAFADLAPQEEGQESDFSECCVFAFPAVVTAIGAARWGELEGAFLMLSKDVQWKVRRSLSFSLHEIAKVVGSDITDKTLLQAWETFLRDLDEVKVGCLTNAAGTIGSASEGMRAKFIQPLAVLPSTTENWRIRETIAGQMGEIAELVDSSTCKKLLQDPTFSLCEDQVADVRNNAYLSCAKVLKKIAEGDGSELMKLITSLLPEKTEDSHFQRRQIFVQVATACVSVGVNTDTFLQKLEGCAADPVPNVRIALAKTMTESFVLESENFAKLSGILEKLKGDSDGDVSKYAEMAKKA